MSSARCFRRRVFRLVWGFRKGHRYLQDIALEFTLDLETLAFPPPLFEYYFILDEEGKRKEVSFEINFRGIPRQKRIDHFFSYLFPIPSLRLRLSDSRYVSSSIEAYRDRNWSDYSFRTRVASLSLSISRFEAMDKRKRAALSTMVIHLYSVAARHEYAGN